MKHTKLFEEFINEKRNKEYTTKDLHKMIINGETIKMSTDGGHELYTYSKDRGQYMAMSVDNFKKDMLNNPSLKNKRFLKNDNGTFILKGTEGIPDMVSKFYNAGGRFKGD